MPMGRSSHSHSSTIDLNNILSESHHDCGLPGSARKRFNSYDFPGYGSHGVRFTPLSDEMEEIRTTLQHSENEHHLGELEATAIAGNDILSSTFYVSGLVSVAAGKLAPVCLALVGVVLYLFRGIYHETVMSLPCNGGTYNILLNCTSKPVASVAAVFNIIAYITTGVVSGLDAIAYLQTVLPEDSIDRESATILLLLFFCLLTNLGIKESAYVAKVIFLMHVATLTVLTIMGTLYMTFNTDLLYRNMVTPYPSLPSLVAGEVRPGSFSTALFYGFSSAMLGISGFETSSQFVEEQAPGVFPKTLRNMWAGVMLFNPLLSLISFSALELDDMMIHKDTVLAKTAEVVGDWIQLQLSIPANYNLGLIFSTIVSVDAFIVLAAALLTSFIGINGMVRRMSMDRCLPQILLVKNPWTGTDSFILVGFFLLCVSQIILLDCNVEALGGVYCFAFLSVMIIFALGNILLKIKRPSLPREITVSWLQSIIGLVSVVIALLGNVLGKPELLTYFFVYVAVVGTLVFIMFQRVAIMRLLFKLRKPKRKKTSRDDDLSYTSGSSEDDGLISVGTASSSEGDIVKYKSFGDCEQDVLLSSRRRVTEDNDSCLSSLSSMLKSVQQVPFIFFCKHDDLHLLNKALLYIQRNEQTNQIIIVHCANQTDTAALTDHVRLVDVLYPKTKISLLILESSFSPTTIEWVSRATDVPINAMFISCPDENFAMKLSQLRGMRIITSYD